jgi:DNA polymerase III sliding clamp (beta) subunit (PCNA family)
MQVAFNTKELLKKLQFLQDGVSKRAYLGSLMQCLITVTDGVMVGSTFNMVALSKVVLARDVNYPDDEFVMPLHRTIASLGKCGEDTTMTVDSESMEVKFKSGRNSWIEDAELGSSWVRPSSDSYPELGDSDLGLYDALSSVAWALDKKGLNPILKGVHINATGNLEVIATDSYSMSLFTFPDPVKGFDSSCTIDMSGLDQVLAVMSKGDHRIGISKRYLAVHSGDFYVSALMLDGRYPNYKAVLIDTDDCDTVSLSREALKNAVGIASAFADPSTSSVLISVDLEEGEMVIRASAAMITGSAVASLPCIASIKLYDNGDGEEVAPRIVFRVDYKRVMNAIASLGDSDEVMFFIPRDRHEGVIRKLAIKPLNQLEYGRQIQLSLHAITEVDEAEVAE